MTISITVPSNDKFAMRVMAEALLRIAAEGEGMSSEKVDKVVTKLVGHIVNERIDIGITENVAPTVSEVVSPAGNPSVDDPEFIKGFSEGIVPAFTEQVPPPPVYVAPDQDSAGYPWDARIHADSKALNADGTWRSRRKPSDMEAEEWATYQDTVRAELKALMSVPVAAFVPPPPVVVAAPLPPVVVPPAPVSDSLPMSFQQLMVWITSHAVANDDARAEQVAKIDAVLATNGLQTLVQLNQRPDLIPQVHAALKGVL